MLFMIGALSRFLLIVRFYNPKHINHISERYSPVQHCSVGGNENKWALIVQAEPFFQMAALAWLFRLAVE